MFRIYSNAVYYVSRWLFSVFLKIFFGFRATGACNIPAKGAFIVASNHVSYIDPVAVGVAIGRKLHFITGEHLYGNRLAALWYNSVDCIRIRRGEADHRAMKRILRCIRGGKPVAIFPEGARSWDGTPQNAYAGIGFLAYKSGAPVIPAFVKGADKALPKGATGFRRHLVEVRIGGAVSGPRENMRKSRKELYREFSERVMNEIALLGAEKGGCK